MVLRNVLNGNICEICIRNILKCIIFLPSNYASSLWYAWNGTLTLFSRQNGSHKNWCGVHLDPKFIVIHGHSIVCKQEPIYPLGYNSIPKLLNRVNNTESILWGNVYKVFYVKLLWELISFCCWQLQLVDAHIQEISHMVDGKEMCLFFPAE